MENCTASNNCKVNWFVIQDICFEEFKVLRSFFQFQQVFIFRTTCSLSDMHFKWIATTLVPQNNERKDAQQHPLQLVIYWSWSWLKTKHKGFSLLIWSMKHRHLRHLASLCWHELVWHSYKKCPKNFLFFISIHI